MHGICITYHIINSYSYLSTYCFPAVERCLSTVVSTDGAVAPFAKGHGVRRWTERLSGDITQSRDPGIHTMH